MKKWGLFLFAGWATATFGLFLATITGEIAEIQFSVVGNGRQIIQAIVMSAIIIPITIILYKRMYRETNRPENPAYSILRVPYIIIGLLFVVVFSFFSLFVMNALDWISLEQWHSPITWGSALFVNLSIALFYEALPEEVIMRGFIYDVLRHKLPIWLSALVQAFIFLAFSASVTLLQVIIGMVSTENIVALLPELILHFFFAIALALMRIWTGSLWASVGFHLSYLAVARFLLMPESYGATPIVTFQDNIMQGVGAIYSIMMVILGTIIFLCILLGLRRCRKNK